MSAKLKNSEVGAKAMDRSFERQILAQARKLAKQYQIVLKFEDGEWYGHGLELPGARGDGKTAAAAVNDTRDALVTTLAYMLEEGHAIPVPASEGLRSEQINIRLTPVEKSLLESRSRAKGFRGVADYLRAAALATM